MFWRSAKQESNFNLFFLILLLAVNASKTKNDVKGFLLPHSIHSVIETLKKSCGNSNLNGSDISSFMFHSVALLFIKDVSGCLWKIFTSFILYSVSLSERDDFISRSKLAFSFLAVYSVFLWGRKVCQKRQTVSCEKFHSICHFSQRVLFNPLAFPFSFPLHKLNACLFVWNQNGEESFSANEVSWSVISLQIIHLQSEI